MPDDDSRTGPPPRPCPSCGAREATCGARVMLSGRTCCNRCDHPADEEETERCQSCTTGDHEAPPTERNHHR